MHKIDAPSATVDNEFTEGSPSGGVPATTVSADWLNDVQEELISILSAAGITPIKGDQKQVLAAKACSPANCRQAETSQRHTTSPPATLTVS